MEHRTNSDILAAVALYVIARTRSHELGATKLNKALWFADCESFRRKGRSVTGLSTYLSLDQGPVPDGLDNRLRDLERAGKISRQKKAAGRSFRREFVSLAEPDTDALTADDIDILRNAIELIAPLPAQEASELSHDELWEETPSGGQMSIAAGAVSVAEMDIQTLQWAEDEARRILAAS